jgi:hypothetical protein
METNVRNYTDQELLDKATSLKSFEGIPSGYWLYFVRSNENASNKFDDKVYFWEGDKCIGVSSCTTNSGTYGLKNFLKWNKKGTAVLASNNWYYDTWAKGMHKGKMKGWVQTLRKVLVYRDNNLNDIAEQIGEPEWGFFGINIHTVTYGLENILKSLIGGWSVGCMVLNDTSVYRKMIADSQKHQEKLTIVLIDEF